MYVDNVTKYGELNRLKDTSIHFTVIFNAFIMMTLCNEINGRKLHNERNVFAGLRNNFFFIVIWLVCFCGQVS